MSKDGRYSRRRWLAACGGTGIAALGGCLRLTDATTEDDPGDGTADAGQATETGVGEDDVTTGDGRSRTTEDDPTSDGSSGSRVELAPAWTGYSSPAATADGDFFFRPGFTTLARVRPDGQRVFETEVDDGYILGVASGRLNTLSADDTGVYVGARAREDGNGARMYALEPETGEIRWTHEEPADGLHHRIGAATRVDDLVVLASQSSGGGSDQRPIVRALDAASGDERWRIDYPEGFIQKILVHGDRLFVQQTFDFYSYRLSTQELIEERGMRTGFSQVVRRDDSLYVPANTVQALELPSGDVRWETDTRLEVNTTPGVSDTGVYVGTESGYVLGLDRESGDELWQWRAPGVLEHPIIVEDGLIWVASDRGDLVALTEKGGEPVFEGEVASGFEFAIQDGVLTDDEREPAFEIRTS